MISVLSQRQSPADLLAGQSLSARSSHWWSPLLRGLEMWQEELTLDGQSSLLRQLDVDSVREQRGDDALHRLPRWSLLCHHHRSQSGQWS